MAHGMVCSERRTRLNTGSGIHFADSKNEPCAKSKAHSEGKRSTIHVEPPTYLAKVL